jgi:hypothetical protein
VLTRAAEALEEMAAQLEDSHTVAGRWQVVAAGDRLALEDVQRWRGMADELRAAEAQLQRLTAEDEAPDVARAGREMAAAYPRAVHAARMMQQECRHLAQIDDAGALSRAARRRDEQARVLGEILFDALVGAGLVQP